MKVNQTGLDQVQSADRKASTEVERPGRTRSGSAPTQPGSDRVEWSDAAREAARQLERIPEVRAERVAALTRRIGQGDYQVPAAEVARKLLEAFRRDRP